MAHKHVPDSQPVQQIQFPRAIRLIDRPIWLGIWRHIVATRRRDVLDANNDSAVVIIVLSVICIGLTLAAIIVIGIPLRLIWARTQIPPVVALVVIASIYAASLPRKPGKHLLRFGFRLRRHRLRRLGIKVVKIAEKLRVDYQKRDALDLKAIVVRAKDLAIFRDVAGVNIMVSRRVVDGRMQPL